MKKIIIFNLLILLLFLGISISIVYAGVSLTVNPTVLEYNVNPGGTSTQNINIINSEGQKQQIKIEVFDGEINGDTIMALTTNSTNTGFQLSPSPQTFVLDKGESKDIEVKLISSSKTSPGGYYKVLSITASDLSGNEQVNVQEGAVGASQKINSSFAVPVLVAVKGKVIDTGQIVKFETDQKQYKSGPVKFNLVFKNTGNIHYKPTGKIVIYKDGQKMGEVTLDSKNVLANSERTLSATWDKKFISMGSYKAQLVLFYGLDNAYSETINTEFEVISGSLAGMGNVILIGGGVLLLFLMLAKGGRRKRR